MRKEKRVEEPHVDVSFFRVVAFKMVRSVKWSRLTYLIMCSSVSLSARGLPDSLICGIIGLHKSEEPRVGESFKGAKCWAGMGFFLLVPWHLRWSVQESCLTYFV